MPSGTARRVGACRPAVSLSKNAALYRDAATSGATVFNRLFAGAEHNEEIPGKSFAIRNAHAESRVKSGAPRASRQRAAGENSVKLASRITSGTPAALASRPVIYLRLLFEMP